MKIAILGSAPSSLHLAPFGDPSFSIWGCSPGVYYQVPRCDAWFELHRWEPPVIGKPHLQKQWFSPEYVAWMSMREPGACPVWMYEAVPEIPASKALPVDDLTLKYGTFFFTSSIAWMIACAIEDILEERAKVEAGLHITTGAQDEIALFGIDMAANEEYGYQRAGCQHFLLLAGDLGIKIVVPPEADLLRPMPLYGICESSHWMIKNTVRKGELEARVAQSTAQLESAKHNLAFMQGALDDLNYQMLTWGEDRAGMGVSFDITAKSPAVRKTVIEEQEAKLKAQPIKPEPTALELGAAARAAGEPPLIDLKAHAKNRKPSSTFSTTGQGNPPLFGMARIKAPPSKPKKRKR